MCFTAEDQTEIKNALIPAGSDKASPDACRSVTQLPPF